MTATDLSLALLGPPVVRRDGAPVTFDTRKATALLALLAVTGREHSREQLAALLWPDADSAKGRASLRRTLSVTAAVMGDGLVISRAAVALNAALVRVDVREFELLIRRAGRRFARAGGIAVPGRLPGRVHPARLRGVRGVAGVGERGAQAGARPRAAAAGRGVHRRGRAGAGRRARPALAAAGPAARTRPSGDHQAARVGRAAFGRHAAIPVAGACARPRPGRPAAAGDHAALRRRARRAARATACPGCGARGGRGG